jgi:serine/threonine-protein kinase
MKTCPVCDTDFPDEKSRCPTDGAALLQSHELDPNKIIRGKYRIVSKLGQGGMGEVYLAEHLMLGGKIALKFLAPDLSKSPRFIKRFRLEAKAAYQLKHPNIVEVIDLDQDEDGTLFIAMEYVEGASLSAVLQRSPGGLPPVRALDFAREVASGLAAAHGRGIIHRDIKPENILIARKQNQPDLAKVLDFGIAAMSEGITDVSRTHGILLTPQYASPEQWRGMPAAELDCRADLYALGGVLYEMLCGRPPYQAANAEGWMFQHLNGNYPSLAALRPDVESQFPGLGELIDCLLARDRDDRLSCAEALVDDLDRILDDNASATDLDVRSTTLVDSVDATPGSEKSQGVRSSQPARASGESRQRTSRPQRTSGPQRVSQRTSRPYRTTSGQQRASGEWATSYPSVRASQPVEPPPQPLRSARGKVIFAAGLVLALAAGGFAWNRLRSAPVTPVTTVTPAPVAHDASAGPASPTTSQPASFTPANPSAASLPSPPPSSPAQHHAPADHPQQSKQQSKPAEPSKTAGNPAPEIQPQQRATIPPRSRPESAAPEMQEISSAASEGMVLSGPKPVYPPVARNNGIAGTVVLNIIISKTGSVTSIEPAAGNPMLQQAATDAVRNWRYRPYIIDGQPVPVKTQVQITFNLH